MRARLSIPLPLDSALALSKELGGSAGPLASLPDADLLQPAHGGGAVLAPLPPPRAAQAAAAAQRQLQARLDAVVAAMQRLKQLAQQAAGQLAAGQAASGPDAAALAPRVPPLFAGSQVRGHAGGHAGGLRNPPQASLLLMAYKVDFLPPSLRFVCRPTGCHQARGAGG